MIPPLAISLAFFQFVPDGSQISAKGIFLEIRLFVAGMHAGNRADTAAFRHISRQRGKGYPHPIPPCTIGRFAVNPPNFNAFTSITAPPHFSLAFEPYLSLFYVVLKTIFTSIAKKIVSVNRGQRIYFFNKTYKQKRRQIQRLTFFLSVLYFSLKELFSGTMRLNTRCSSVVSFVSTI